MNRVVNLRNRRGRLRTDFGARIAADRLGRYLAAHIEAQLEAMYEEAAARAALWEDFAVQVSEEGIKVVKLMDPLL